MTQAQKRIHGQKPVFSTVVLKEAPADRKAIQALLAASSLQLDTQVGTFVVCRIDEKIVACGGVDANIIKDVVVDREHRGNALSLQLGGELIKLALANGQSHLFLCCQPENVALFGGWGFYPLVEVPGRIALMENSPVAMKNYCEALKAELKPGKNVGCVVLHADPLTLGDVHIVKVASDACDWVHVFVAPADATFIGYDDRFSLVTDGLADVAKITIHHGPDYIISRDTFPGYLFEDKALVDSSWAGVDLLIFREYIAPALGINRRYVGAEPRNAVTKIYNDEMEQWLQHARSPRQSVETIIVPDTKVGGKPVSAATVRSLLQKGDFKEVGRLVNAPTLDFLKSHKTKPGADQHKEAGEHEGR